MNCQTSFYTKEPRSIHTYTYINALASHFAYAFLTKLCDALHAGFSNDGLDRGYRSAISKVVDPSNSWIPYPILCSINRKRSL